MNYSNYYKLTSKLTVGNYIHWAVENKITLNNILSF